MSGCTTRRTRPGTSSSYTPSNLVSATISRYCSRETTPRRTAAVVPKKGEKPPGSSLMRRSKQIQHTHNDSRGKEPHVDSFSGWPLGQGDCLFQGICKTFDGETERRRESNQQTCNQQKAGSGNRVPGKTGTAPRGSKASKARCFRGRDINYKAEVLDQLLQCDSQARECSQLELGELPA